MVLLSIAELISSSGINIICSSIRRLVRGRGLHDRGGAGDVVQDREAAEEEVRHRVAGVAAHDPPGLCQAEVPGEAGPEGLDDDDQEGRATAQDAEEDALQTEVVLLSFLSKFLDLSFI